MAAIAYQYEGDFDLRSRCLLLPTHLPRVEFLKRDGSGGEIVQVDSSAAAQILSECVMYAKQVGIPWEANEIRLEPAPKLLELIARSHKVAATQPNQG